MERFRAIKAALVVLPWLMLVAGCANLRLPAIDPSGRGIFLPNPNYTTLAEDGPLGPFARRGPVVNVQPGPYQPALLNRQRQRLADHFRSNSLGVGPTASSNDALFQSPANPPLCGPDGNAPDGGLCFPVGSPSESSLMATIPRTGQVGSGIPGLPPAPVSIGQLDALARLARLGPGVVLAQKQFVAPVETEVVVVGGVQSTSGVMRPGEPVHWSLSNDSVGTIVDVAKAPPPGKWFGLLQETRKGQPGCGDCVASVTSGRCYTLPRNPAYTYDDVTMLRGQSWVSLTSGSEGTSYVTLAAPGLPSGRHATASIIWIDAELHYPRPVLNSVESPAQLITRVVRRSDKSPLSGWLVRYSILEDGLDARLNQAGDRTLLVITDELGRAVVNLRSVTGQPGTTRLDLEILKPATETSAALRVGKGIGYVTWSESEPMRAPTIPRSDTQTETPVPPLGVPPMDRTEPEPTGDAPASPMATPPSADQPVEPPRDGPALQISSLVPPQSPMLGDTLPYRITIENTGESTARDVRVLTRPDIGTKFVQSDPSPSLGPQGGIAWQLGDIPAGTAKSVNVQFQFTELGAREIDFRVDSSNASPVFDIVTPTVEPDPITIRVSDPTPFRPRVNDIVSFEIFVTNNTNQRITADLNVLYDDGLEPEVEQSQPERGITRRNFSIPARSTESIELSFKALRAGTFAHRVQLDGYAATADGTVRIAPAQERDLERLKVEVASGPKSMRAGTAALFVFSIINQSDETVSGVKIDYRSTSDLYVDEAEWTPETSEDGFVQTWSIPSAFPPGTGVQLKLWLKANEKPVEKKPENQIRVVSDRGVEDFGALPVEIVESS